jgi:hypothetical protein
MCKGDGGRREIANKRRGMQTGEGGRRHRGQERQDRHELWDGRQKMINRRWLMVDDGKKKTGGRRWEKGGVEGRKREKEDDRRGKNKWEEKREKRKLKREDGSQAQEKVDRKLKR